MKILLVEESKRLQRSISTGLRQHANAVDQAYDGEQALKFIETGDYDVIILDLMLPKVDGLTVLSEMRRKSNTAHVLILSAKDQTEDRIRGLDLGADDYLVKPFSFDELVSRIRALFRRRLGLKNPLVQVGQVELDTVRRVVTYNDEPLPLTPREFALFEYLARRRGQVFSHSQLIEQLYDSSTCVTQNVIEVHVSALRKKLKQAGAPVPIRTRRGFGYLIE